MLSFSYRVARRCPPAYRRFQVDDRRVRRLAEANHRDLVGRFRYDVDEIVFGGFGLGERLAGREN